MTALHEMTLVQLGGELRAKRTSSREIIDSLLSRIAEGDGKLHAFVDLYSSEARTLADAADTQRAAGLPLGTVHGLPIAFKDLCDIAGKVGTGGSRMFEARVATETSATVERLLAAGMVPLGKLHMVEFALGGWGTNPLMGTPWNPWDLTRHRCPGGSSSGTGVAVAARLTPAGIGSDTGGSVRIPCAFNGLVGLKVTHGRISLHGTLLLSWTLDTIGPMARCVEDCALLLHALAAPDPRDPTTLSQPLEDFVAATANAQNLKGVRIALPDAAQLPSFSDKGVVSAWLAAARTLESLGASVEAAPLPQWYFELMNPSGSVSVSEAFALHRDYIEDMSKPIGEFVRKRMLGAKSYLPSYYAEELRRMAQRRREFAEWFSAYDAILTPGVAVPAVPVDELDEMGPVPAALTRAGNYLGLCALSMPSGLSNGLPVGIQIIGKPFAESTVLRIGKAFQDATRFHTSAPDLSSIGL